MHVKRKWTFVYVFYFLGYFLFVYCTSAYLTCLFEVLKNMLSWKRDWIPFYFSATEQLYLFIGTNSILWFPSLHFQNNVKEINHVFLFIAWLEKTGTCLWKFLCYTVSTVVIDWWTLFGTHLLGQQLLLQPSWWSLEVGDLLSLSSGWKTVGRRFNWQMVSYIILKVCSVIKDVISCAFIIISLASC